MVYLHSLKIPPTKYILITKWRILADSTLIKSTKLTSLVVWQMKLMWHLIRGSKTAISWMLYHVYDILLKAYSLNRIHWRRDKLPSPVFLGFPCGSAGKEYAYNAVDLHLIPGLGRSHGEGRSYPLQYSGLEDSMDCTVHGITKSQTQLSNFHFISLQSLESIRQAKGHSMKQLDSGPAHDLWNPGHTEKAGTLVQNLLTLLRSNIRALNQLQNLSKHEALSGHTGPTLMKPGLPGPFKRVTVFKVKGRPRVCSLLKAKETWQQNTMQFLHWLLLPKKILLGQMAKLEKGLRKRWLQCICDKFLFFVTIF